MCAVRSQISRPKVLCRIYTRNKTTRPDSLEILGYEQYLESIMDEVAIGQDFLTTLRCSPVNIIATRHHIHILSIYHQRYTILAF
jgi:hypothetical protein